MSTPFETMPAGTYLVGDPCYAFPHDAPHTPWMEWLNAAGLRTDNTDFLVDPAHLAIGIGTAYGDGTYEDQTGNTYGVDSGLLGVVSEAIWRANGGTEVPYGMRRVTFNDPFQVGRRDDGTVQIGHIYIATGDEDEYGW